MNGFCYYCGENLQTDLKRVWCTGDQCEFGVTGNVRWLPGDGIAVILPHDLVTGAIFHRRELEPFTWKNASGEPVQVPNDAHPNPDWIPLTRDANPTPR